MRQQLRRPSRIDFADVEQVRAWVADTVARKPWRPAFFEAFADELNSRFDGPVRVAELGSGPGHLAQVILGSCRIASYAAVDLSPAMQEIAREHLGAAAEPVRFVTADFREPDWPAQVGRVDALLTMQAAHEVRHKARLPRLLSEAFDVLYPGGLLLFCDHYAQIGSDKNPELFLAPQEQPVLLAEAGFTSIRLIRDAGGMALLAAERP